MVYNAYAKRRAGLAPRATPARTGSRRQAR
jgi:hypothetical protein